MSNHSDVSTNFNIVLPADQAAGHFADFVSVWHNQETFVLDFVSITGPPKHSDTPTGEHVHDVDCQIVSRVRVPPAQIWEMMKALESQLGQWEKENPQRQHPES